MDWRNAVVDEVNEFDNDENTLLWAFAAGAVTLVMCALLKSEEDLESDSERRSNRDSILLS